MIAASHLPDVHPTREAVLLKDVSKYSHFILVVPLIADEHLSRFHFGFCNACSKTSLSKFSKSNHELTEQNSWQNDTSKSENLFKFYLGLTVTVDLIPTADIWKHTGIWYAHA